MNIINKKDIWCGLFQVKANEGNHDLEGAIGAFVHVLAVSRNKEEYLEKSVNYINDNNFSIIKLGKHSSLLDFGNLDEELEESARELNHDNQTVFSVFDCYMSL